MPETQKTSGNSENEICFILSSKNNTSGIFDGKVYNLFTSKKNPSKQVRFSRILSVLLL